MGVSGLCRSETRKKGALKVMSRHQMPGSGVLAGRTESGFEPLIRVSSGTWTLEASVHTKERGGGGGGAGSVGLK